MTANESGKGGKTGLLLVWAAVLIFAAANSIVQILSDLGAQRPVDGRNAVTFCNILFVGNVCAFLTLAAVYRKQWTRENLAAMTTGDWISLVVIAVLSSALGPGLIFLAIENTSVTNVVLVGRLEPPLFLALSAIFLADRPDRWTVIAAVISLIGVGVIIVLQGGEDGVMIGKGEGQAALGAAALAASTVFSKARLGRIPLGIFTVFRTGLGAVIFFAVAAYLYGIMHFADALAPFLWQTMIIYGAVIVVGGQLCWFKGVKSTKAGEASLATSFSPIAGVAFAFLLLGEEPDRAVLIGGGIILIGIAVGQIGGTLARRREALQLAGVVEMEGRTGFKGV